MASKEDYDKAVDEFVRSIRSRLSEKVISVYAAGSYARGDFVPGRSDIDVYVVTKIDSSGIEKELRSFADPIVEKYLRDVKLIQPGGSKSSRDKPRGYKSREIVAWHRL